MKILREHAVNVRMTKQEYATVEKLAVKLGVSVSDVIRLSVKESARKLLKTQGMAA